jgi:LysM repeat protein
MGRMSFLVSTLLAFALAATVLAAALLVGIFPSGPGGVAVATTPPARQSLAPEATGTPTPTLAPTPTPAPTVQPTAGGVHTVQAGESLSYIGELYGIPWQTIAEVNGILPPDYVIIPGQELIIPSVPQPTSNADIYVVQAGDNIYKIADLLEVDPTDLADFNNLIDWNSIKVGDILYIPRPGWTPRPLPTD